MKRREFTVAAVSLSLGLSGCSESIAESGNLDASTVEEKIHERINNHRSENGLSQLQFDEELADIARGHSKDMANNGFFDHESPTNGSMEDRYEAANYDCQVSTSGNQYTTGAENISKTWYQVNIESDDGTVILTSESEVAEYIVQQWMNSQGHRENILEPYWKNEGIGVAITKEDGNTAVYATQNFC